MKLFDFNSYVGKNVPSGEVYKETEQGSYENVNLDQYIEDKYVILVGIPGAFTPTCTNKHLPGFVQKEKELRAQGIDEIICMSVNDPHVMMAFADYINSDGAKITMVADPLGEVSEQLKLLTDMGVYGPRCKRFAAIINNGKITKMFVDEKGLDQSTAHNCLDYIRK
jgi:peroxiredoxin